MIVVSLGVKYSKIYRFFLLGNNFRAKINVRVHIIYCSNAFRNFSSHY
jgi:hypothetical protein